MSGWRDNLSHQKKLEFLENALDAAGFGVAIVDRRGEMLFTNDVLCRLLGKPKDRLLGSTFPKALGLKLSPQQAKAASEVLSGVSSGFSAETEYSAPGSKLWLRLCLVPLARSSKALFVLFVEDVTEQVTSRQYAAQQHERLRLLYETATLLNSEHSLDAILEGIVRGVSEVFGFQHCSVRLVDRDRNLLVTKAVHGIGEEYWRHRATIPIGKHSYDTSGWVALDGEPRYVPDLTKLDFPEEVRREIIEKYGFKSYLCIPIKCDDEILGVFSIMTRQYRQFSEEEMELLSIFAKQAGQAIVRARLYDALKESELWYRTLFETTGTALIVIEEDTTIALANEEFARLSGYSREEIEGKVSWTKFVAPQDLERMKRYHRLRRIDPNAAPRQYEFTFVDRSGNIKNVFITIDVIPGTKLSIASLIDITRLRKLERELERIQRLESLGLMASGIAHDFNNILTAILGNVSLAKLYTSPKEKVYSLLGDAERAALRARDLTSKLLTFARGGEPSKKLIPLAEVVADTAEIALSGSGSRLVLKIPDDLWDVEADEVQIRQVLENLVINADQAMPEGGVVEISCENVVVEEGASMPLKPGRYVRISVRDEGIGIPEEHIPKIFDPFFTTKQRGSGLGLSTAFSIVKRHGGHISVESELGRGSTFYVWLPAAEEAAQKRASTELTAPKARSGNILLMDDDEGARAAVKQMLEGLGYNVEVAGDGEEAVRLYQATLAQGGAFDAVILNLTVPGALGGREVLEKLRAIDPNVKAIAASGYHNDPAMTNFRKYGFDGAVPKPFRLDELVAALDRIIGAEGKE